MKSVLKFIVSMALVSGMYQVAWKRGELTGSMGVGYWQGWHDAMMQTDFGKKPYNSEESLLR